MAVEEAIAGATTPTQMIYYSTLVSGSKSNEPDNTAITNCVRSLLK